MLATRGDHVPTGTDWVHEVKWDGIRALVDVADGVRVWSRSGRDLSLAFPELAELGEVADDLLLDGEIVALGDGGVPSLGGLADRIHITDARKAKRLAAVRPVTLLAFDVLRYDGRDLDRLPWSERRAVLEGIGLDDVSWQVPATYDDGQSLLAAAEVQGLEGIVSKRVTGRYQWGARSRDWLKFPIRPTGSFVVGGYRHETDSLHRLGAVLVGQPTPHGLEYRGRVGSGIAGKAGRALADLLAPLVRADDPFLDVPAVDAHGTVWVEPVLVVDVQYLRVTTDGRLRHRRTAASAPTSPPTTCEVVRMPDEVHVEVDGRTLKLSNLDKVLYPQTGTTKGEVLNYYAQVAPVLLPHVADRAVTGSAGPTAPRSRRSSRRTRPRCPVVAADRQGADDRLARLVQERRRAPSSRSSTGWRR